MIRPQPFHPTFFEIVGPVLVLAHTVQKVCQVTTYGCAEYESHAHPERAVHVRLRLWGDYSSSTLFINSQVNLQPSYNLAVENSRSATRYFPGIK